MSPASRMTADELRASVSLSSIFGLRMLGMFVILPVFAIYAENLPGGDNLTLVGIAIGAYGLTQAILQIPFGLWSDQYGRKPVIYAGLVVFAVGSFVAAAAPDIYVVILGRVLQGAGAISAAVMAMAADLTREEHRAKAMAMIGSTIGATFALSLVASPWLNRVIGVPGIFALTGVLSIAAIGVVYRAVPDVAKGPRQRGYWPMGHFVRVLQDTQLARLNYGMFALHALLMALFIAVPFSLRDAGLKLDQHWQVYLPVMLGSFVFMLPFILRAGRPDQLRRILTGSVGVLLAIQMLMPFLTGRIWLIGLFLLVFFTAFNVLEATLPTLVSRMAPARSKGAAIGVFTSVQFLGAFVGAAAGGYVYGRWGATGVVVLDAAMLVIWLVMARGTRVPAVLSTRIYALRALDPGKAEGLMARLQALPGVHEALVSTAEGTASLKVDSARFDEHNVLNLIEGET
jgi:MFS family permease